MMSRSYLLTINNPLDVYPSLESACVGLVDKFGYSYVVGSSEVGESGTHHWHIYVTGKTVRFKALKKHAPTAHIDKCKGNPPQNRAYIVKDLSPEQVTNGDFFEFGICPAGGQGTRNDLTELYANIKEGLSDAEILELNPKYLLRLEDIRKTRAVILQDKFRRQFRELKVIYIWGKTSTGKTRYVMESNGYENVYRVTDYKNPFDSYEDQGVICFDEFRSQIAIADMLNYLDGYPLTLPARYANRIACFETVYIVSNIPLEDQYTKVQYREPESYKAFMRRITEIKEFNLASDVII